MSSRRPGVSPTHRARGRRHRGSSPAGPRRSISPSPRCAWRSAPVPGGSRESLACRRSIRPTIARTRSTASDELLAGGVGVAGVEAEADLEPPRRRPQTASQRPRQGVEPPGDGVVAAGGVLDVDRDLGLEHLQRPRPAARLPRRSRPRRGRGGRSPPSAPTVGGRVAGLLEDLARAVADVRASASRR